MNSLFAVLRSAANSLQTFDQAIGVTQQNVTNSATAGYARRIASLVADNDLVVTGGVKMAPIADSRDWMAEQSVWRESSSRGAAGTMVSQLARLERAFPVRGDASIPAALDQFFQSVSHWSTQPNDLVARQQVLGHAEKLAGRITATGTQMAQESADADRAIRTKVDVVNRLADEVADFNREVLRSGQASAAMHTALSQSLEALGAEVKISALTAENGTISVYIAGQNALVLGANVYTLSRQTSQSETVVLDGAGNPVPSKVLGGALGSLLRYRNQTVPEAQQTFASFVQVLAGSVNQQLQAGLDAAGQPQSGLTLFTFDTTAPALTFVVNTAVAAEELTAASAGAPGGNANAVALAELGRRSVVGSPPVWTLTGAYGQLAGHVGGLLSDARAELDLSESLLQHAREIREGLSGVNLDEEATVLLTLQKSYQASARVIQVIDELTETVINLGRR